MRKLVLVLVLFLFGCSGGVYKIPASEYQKEVKTLGVLPVLVDTRAVIQHPQSDQIISLLRRASEGLSVKVVEALRNKKGYFDVRLVQEPPRLVAEKLLLRSEVDELGQPAGYQLNQGYLADLCQETVVDGVLILSLQGAVHNDKRWSRNTFENLVTDYNDILATATVVAADGRVLWEMNGEDSGTILNLQYADFDEAFFNKTDAVKLKFISMPGLEKTLLPPATEGDSAPGSPQLESWLKKVESALSPSLFR